ncbi:MAG: pyridoxal-phosphate dependent enzyme [Vicingaceae bacterium]
MDVIPTKKDLLEAQSRIAPFIHQTPVLSSKSINEIFGMEVYFKCENFQKMGAFKMRGATNALLSLPAHELKKGVTTHSSGNFAQAVALAAKLNNIKAIIVMPENAPKVKKDAVLGYGAKVITCESTQEARERATAKVVLEYGCTMLHPYNSFEVIAGNASASIELLNQVKGLDVVIAPVGGGGLLSGTALGTKYFGKAQVFGAEPENANDAYTSFKTGNLITKQTPSTIADGLRTTLGDKCFKIIKNEVKDIFLVSEQEIIDAMKLVWERMKIIIEPSSAVAVAGLLKNKEKFKNKKAGIIISGGNVDLKNLPF